MKYQAFFLTLLFIPNLLKPKSLNLILIIFIIMFKPQVIQILHLALQQILTNLKLHRIQKRNKFKAVKLKQIINFYHYLIGISLIEKE
jgi:hypothetical protein